jgi:hypothetical protein
MLSPDCGGRGFWDVFAVKYLINRLTPAIFYIMKTNYIINLSTILQFFFLDSSLAACQACAI